MYKIEMENALKKSVRKIEQINFMKRYRLSDGASYLQAKNLWKYENRYDSENDTINSDEDEDENENEDDGDENEEDENEEDGDDEDGVEEDGVEI